MPAKVANKKNNNNERKRGGNSPRLDQLWHTNHLGTWPKERKEYHSVRLAFPNMTAPPFLSFSTTPASRATTEPSSAYDPAVVFNLSLLAIVSFSSTGIPCNSPNAATIERSWFPFSCCCFLESEDRHDQHSY